MTDLPPADTFEPPITELEKLVRLIEKMRTAQKHAYRKRTFNGLREAALSAKGASYKRHVELLRMKHIQRAGYRVCSVTGKKATTFIVIAR